MKPCIGILGTVLSGGGCVGGGAATARIER